MDGEIMKAGYQKYKDQEKKPPPKNDLVKQLCVLLRKKQELNFPGYGLRFGSNNQFYVSNSLIYPSFQGAGMCGGGSISWKVGQMMVESTQKKA
jgi:hypothetical protein